jgi:hypothetical protein
LFFDIDFVAFEIKRPADLSIVKRLSLNQSLVVAAMIHVLEATIRHKGKPPRWVALTLQPVTLAAFHRLTLTLAKSPQHLKVHLVLLKFIFHSFVISLTEKIIRRP